jgi:hypothetical protein
MNTRKIRGAAWRSTSPVSVSPHLSSVQAKALCGSVGGELDERGADRAPVRSRDPLHCIFFLASIVKSLIRFSSQLLVENSIV